MIQILESKCSRDWSNFNLIIFFPSLVLAFQEFLLWLVFPSFCFVHVCISSCFLSLSHFTSFHFLIYANFFLNQSYYKAQVNIRRSALFILVTILHTCASFLLILGLLGYLFSLFPFNNRKIEYVIISDIYNTQYYIRLRLAIFI